MRLLRMENNKNNIYNYEQTRGDNTRYACNKPSAR